ncbi:MAG: twin-arginine translocation signal domain-containing protein [Bacteroidota bacterium]
MNAIESKKINKSRRSFLGKAAALAAAAALDAPLARKIFSSKNNSQSPIDNRQSAIPNSPRIHPLSVKRKK